MNMNAKQCGKIAGLVVALVAILIGSLVFAGAVSGWFDGPKIALDREYYCEGQNCSDNDLLELTVDEYRELSNAKKTFAVFVDKDGCTTADKMRSFVLDYMKENGVKIYRISYEDMKETSMHELVKYYPSVAIISKGKVFKFLKADSNEDVDAFENKEAFNAWMNKYL